MFEHTFDQWRRGSTMRRYDDPIEVRRGMVTGGVVTAGVPEEGPEQFLWRGRLWHVRAVVGHWLETGPWWRSPSVRAVVGTDGGSEQALAAAAGTTTLLEPDLMLHDLLREREVWRVEACSSVTEGFGVYDLVLDWTSGSWRLACCLD